MNQLNALAAVVVGGYLIAVIFAGNLKPLWATMQEDAGFVPWALAVLILYGLTLIPGGSPIVGPLIALVVIAMLILAGKPMLDTLSNYFGGR